MRPEQYKRIDIHPKKVLPEMLSLRLGRTRAMAAFSGGIDGSFSAIRHAKKMLGLPSYPVTHVLHIHGLDVDADRQDQFDKLLLRTAPLIADAGVKRVVVKTNIRKPTPCKWEDGFGAIVAGILHMVGSRFRYGMIGSSEPYSHPLVPWGSTPGTDYLLSGGKMDIVHDGAGYTRTEKAAFLAGYPSAISGMRVCYSGEEQHNNCGTCEKCVRTRLNFMAVGVDDPPLFDTPFTLEMIDGLAPKNSRQRAELETIVAYAESRKTNAVWLRNLKARLSALC